MDIETAISSALSGEAVLFCGAGFSMGATNLRGKPMKSGSELAAHLSGLCDLGAALPLEDASARYISQFDVDSLISELRQEYTAKDISQHQLDIAQVPWRRVYTTNYDDVLETAYARCSRQLTPVTFRDSIHRVPKDPTLGIHFNGFIDRLDRDSILSELKLTDSSYITSSVMDSAWASYFRNDLNAARCVFFVGYSLADLDIKRLIFPLQSLKAKCFFMVGDNPDISTQLRIEMFGMNGQMDAASLGNALSAARASFVPSLVSVSAEYCLRKETPQIGPANISDQDVFDLVLLGQVVPSGVWQSLHGGTPYVIERTRVDLITHRLAEGDSVIVHSELANGKTLAIDCIKCRAYEKGLAVYSLVKKSDTLPVEIENTLIGKGRAVIIIDGYADWMDEIPMIARSMPSGTSLLLAARSAANDVLYDSVCSGMSVDGVLEIPVDQLDDDELVLLSAFFDHYGLWGENAASSPQRKIAFLRDKCHAQFSTVLIHLFESPQIQSRLQLIMRELQRDRTYHAILVTVLALAVLQYPTSTTTLLDLCGERVFDGQFRHNPIIAQMIDFSNGEVRLRSSAVAEFILKRVADPDLTVDALVSATSAADKHCRASEWYADLRTKFVRFATLQHMIPERDKLRSILRYYEGIKNLYGCREYPLFWLQYAIACTALEEFPRAKKYFDDAYAFARKRNDFDTYQIDNHFARYLLAEVTWSGDASRCMKAFRDARKTIFSQITTSERFHYPYRVASLFSPFWDRFGADLTPPDREEFLKAAKFVMSKLVELPDHRRLQRDVVACEDALDTILAS
jgi:hypothetical protein